MSRKILVVAAHTDDEVLGCAGTIAKHVACGDSVHLLFMTDGVGSRDSGVNEVDERLLAAQKAASILQVSSFTNLDFPDNQMDTQPLLNVVKALETKIRDIEPEVIYTHHIGDLNVDHQVTHKAVMTACRPQPGASVKEIYAFEVLSSTEWQTPSFAPFIPNVFVDISNYIDVKKQAVTAYELEMRSPPHSRSVDNAMRLTALRGNNVGVAFAESFVLLRFLK